MKKLCGSAIIIKKRPWELYMDSNLLFDKIEQLFPEYVEILAHACDIESPTEYKPGVDACAAFFTDIAKTHGWDVEIQREAIAGDPICITLNPDAKGEPICLSGHIDTVHPLGLFKKPRVKNDGERLHGPGAFDCKGGVVASLLAMDALEQCGFDARPVRLIIQTDEETGSSTSSKSTLEFMKMKSENAIAFLNTEGMVRGTLVLERKGILRYEFIVRGVACHSAICQEGASAIVEAAYKILELEKMKDSEGLTCNCGVIKGGTVANSVCDLCTFTADIRFASAEQLKQAEKICREVALTTHIEGCVCELCFVSLRPAMERADRNYELLDRINEICNYTGLQALKPRKALGGSDAAYVTEFGIPCIDSIGVRGAWLHSINEYMILESLMESAKYQAAIAAYI